MKFLLFAQTHARLLVIVLLVQVVVSCDNTTREQNANAVDVAPPPSAFEGNTFKEVPVVHDYSKFYAGTDTLRIATSEFNKYFVDSIQYFDPHNALRDVEVQVAHALYSSLFSLHPVTGAVTPHVVKSWTTREEGDGHTYVFVLHDLQWSDGTPLNAGHIRSSLLRYLSPVVKNPYATTLSLSIKGATEFHALPSTSDEDAVRTYEQNVAITAVDKHTLHITAPSGADLLAALAHPTAAILPITNSQDIDNGIFDITSENWNGLGAFVFLRASHNSISLRARKGFWKRQWVKTVHYNFVENVEDAIQLFVAGDVDWVLLPYGTYREGQSENPTITKNIHSVEYASEIIMDVPVSSVLRTMYRELQRILTEIVENLKVYEVTTLKSQPKRLFFPTMVLPPARSTGTTLFEPYVYELPIETEALPFSSRNPQSYEPSNQFVSTTEIFEKLKTLLSNSALDTKKIRIGYSSPFLLKFAEQIASVFHGYGVPVEVTALPVYAPSTEDYDIAIRNLPLTIERPVGILSQYWWVHADDARAPSTHSTLFTLMTELTRAESIEVYFDALVKIEQELLATAYIVPLGYMSKQEIIDTTEYPWWTPLMSWHPWFP